MFVRSLFLVGLIFFILSLAILAALFFLPQPSSAAILLTPRPPLVGGGGPPCGCLAEEDIGNLHITKYWPTQMDLNTSDTIRVLLIPDNFNDYLSDLATTAGSGTHRVASEKLGTIEGGFFDSGETIAGLFGSDSEPFATAHLAATTFDVQPTGSGERPLDLLHIVEWSWIISPKILGRQVINVDIDIVWRSKKSGQVIHQVQLWQSNFDIKVTQPFFDSSQLTAGALASAFLGLSSLFASIIAWGLAQISTRWDERRKGQDKGSKASNNSDGTGERPPPPAQPQLEKENKTGVDQQKDKHVGEVKVQEVKSSAQLQQRSRAISVGIRALLIILSLLIIGGSVLIYYAKVLRPAQLSAQATVAVTHATATAQSQLTATATSVQHLLTTSTRGSTALNDPLRDNSGHHGWAEGTNCAFTGGSYHVTVAKQGYIHTCLALLTTFADFAYQVQLSIRSGNEGCLILRYSVRSNTHSYDAFDAFCVSNDGYYDFITKLASVTTYTVLKSGFNPAFINVANATNTVTVIAQALQYTMYINNQNALTVTDKTTSQGAIGVGARDVDNATDVAFSNAKVWTLS